MLFVIFLILPILQKVLFFLKYYSNIIAVEHMFERVVPLNIEILRELLVERIQIETDTDLLDLIYKLLLHEGSHDALDADIILCG